MTAFDRPSYLAGTSLLTEPVRRKIFVSYKHRDSNVQPIGGRIPTLMTPITARDYVNDIEGFMDATKFGIFKGERKDENLSNLKNESIKSQLRDQIYDSSVTIILISPSMRDWTKSEDDQFIPWEIAFSLKETTRGDGRTSRTNALLNVVLPASDRSFDHFVVDHTCSACASRTLRTDRTFGIISRNMFNLRKVAEMRTSCGACVSYPDDVSYIPTVKWPQFAEDPSKWIEHSVARQRRLNDYKLSKQVLP